MDDEGAIKLTMTGRLSYDDEITVAQAAQIITYLNSGEVLISPVGPPAGGSGTVGSSTGSRRSGLTPRDALAVAGANTNPEKIVAFALYVEQQGGKETFTLEDIKPLFRQARESTPGNLSRDLDAAIRSGWVAASSDKGEYYVTESAARVLDSGFDSIRPGRSAGGSKAKSAGSSHRSRKTSIPMPEVFKDIEISPSIEGYINYHKVKTKTDKYLWAINAAKLWGIDALTNSEIVWLTDKLGVGISSADLAGYYRGNYKHGYVNKNTEGKIRMLPAGTGHLASLKAGAGE